MSKFQTAQISQSLKFEDLSFFYDIPKEKIKYTKYQMKKR